MAASPEKHIATIKNHGKKGGISIESSIILI
jgi:hypothetical protein